MKNKLLCIFGDIEFIGEKAIVKRIDLEEVIDEDIAESYCEAKISSGKYDAYVIPDHFYTSQKVRGVVDYSFCRTISPKKLIKEERNRSKPTLP